MQDRKIKTMQSETGKRDGTAVPTAFAEARRGRTGNAKRRREHA